MLPRALARLALVALPLSILGLILARGVPRQRPEASTPASTLTLPELRAPVRIVDDRFGIPHIRAQSLEDLYLAWGFVTARDRMWELEVNRRAARGSLWQWFGNRALRDDGGAQLFEIERRARSIWQRERADTELRTRLERYTAGVNAYLAECRTGARPWPREMVRLQKRPDDWGPEDTVLLLLAQGVLLDLDLPELEEADSARTRGLEWVTARRRFEETNVVTTIPDSAARRLYGAPPASRPRIHDSDAATPRRQASPPSAGSTTSRERTEAPAGASRSWLPTFPGLRAAAGARLGTWLGDATDDPDLRASNVFAVGGARSASGKPLLANDPHLSLGAPSPLYVVHVDVPGQVDAIGATVPGLPAIVSGRNRTCAWGITALSADVIDVYADTVSSDGRRVLSMGRWVPVRQESFTMRLTFGPLLIPLFGQTRRYTPHGPVVVFDRRRRLAYAVRWAVPDSAITLRRLIGIERSRTASEVVERYRTQVTPGLNVVAADVEGRVIYQTAGVLPRRGFEPVRGLVPDDGRHEWSGYVSGAAMPAWQAPAGGFVVNSNNLPAALYREPLPRFDWAHDRAARIAARLGGDPSVTLADLRSVQNDVYSRGGERFVQRLLACADSLAPELTARERAVLDTLRRWDLIARRDRVGPTIYRAWYGALQRRSRLGNLVGLTAAALDGRAPEALSDSLGRPERPAKAAVEALRVALRALDRRLGPDLRGWRWGRAHRASFAHRLAWKDSTFAVAPVPADGDNSTPCVGRSGLPWSATFNHGPVFRHLVDLAAPDSSLGVVPPGNSGDSAGRHAGDLLQLWANHGYVPFYLDWERIERVKESETVLGPRR